MELQQGVVGGRSAFVDLAAAADAGQVVRHAGELVRAARRAGVPVVHCTAELRTDGAGSVANCRLLAAALRHPDHVAVGSPGAALVPELGPEPSDLVCPRLHGVSPFIGTPLDRWLRNLGATVVVVAGVSLNVGVLGLVIEAVNLGYEVVVAEDAVCGVPESYARAVLDHTVPLLATVAPVADVTACWET
jgi:nicotinamidase-related amidase